MKGSERSEVRQMSRGEQVGGRCSSLHTDSLSNYPSIHERDFTHVEEGIAISFLYKKALIITLNHYLFDQLLFICI